MFKFTTETILNDLNNVTGLLGAATLPASEVPWDPGIELTKRALWIKRLNKFVVAGTNEYVKGAAVYRRVYSAAALAQSRFTIPTTVVGTLYRVGVQLTTNGYSDGMFARDRVTYGKPFYVELLATSTVAATSATALANAWNKTFASYDNFVTASTSTAALIFTADNNPYIQIKALTLETIDTTTGIATDITPTVTVNTVGAPSFGDYSYLLKNHRLPTLDNYRPFGLNQEELPIVGATYNQYTLYYIGNRDQMGQSVVGQNAVSETTHVIWVNQAAPKVSLHLDTAKAAGTAGDYDFEMILEVLGLAVKDAVTGADVTVTLPTEA
jgi:hypothetical protein